MEFPLVVFPHLLEILQKLHRQADDVVKVHGIVCLQSLLVFPIGFGYFLQPVIPSGLGRPGKGFRGLLPVLHPADHTQHGFGRKRLVVQAHGLDDVLHDPLGIRRIIDGKAPAIAQPLNFPAQNPAASGMEGHSPHIIGSGAHSRLQTGFQLVGRLVGKGYGNDVPGSCRAQSTQPLRPALIFRRHFLLQSLQKRQVLLRGGKGNLRAVAAAAKGNQIGNPLDQHRGFATACPSQQKQRSLRRQHGLPLHWIQLPKPGRNIAPPGSCKSRLKILCHSMSHPRLMGLFYYIFRRA
ncbi:putative uncharacterized protein [Firmicutes bacterium CAG:137]|nr:putative uncharacterized protein [Firmicutes bacterium CAG:137]